MSNKSLHRTGKPVGEVDRYIATKKSNFTSHTNMI